MNIELLDTCQDLLPQTVLYNLVADKDGPLKVRLQPSIIVEKGSLKES